VGAGHSGTDMCICEIVSPRTLFNADTLQHNTRYTRIGYYARSFSIAEVQHLTRRLGISQDIIMTRPARTSVRASFNTLRREVPIEQEDGIAIRVTIAKLHKIDLEAMAVQVGDFEVELERLGERHDLDMI
jgi:hypothetical protein